MKLICTECDWLGIEDALLSAPNPFDYGFEIIGCPKCRAVNSVTEACDEPGCNEQCTCGWPTSDGGYRRTCYKHWKK